MASLFRNLKSFVSCLTSFETTMEGHPASLPRTVALYRANTLRRIKRERAPTPGRWSKRLRKLSPSITSSVLTTVSKRLVRPRSVKLRKRKHLYKKGFGKGPLQTRSVPQLRTKRVGSKNPYPKEVQVGIRGSSCTPKLILKKSKTPLKKIYVVSKQPSNIKTKSIKQEKEGPLYGRKKYVLEVLNRGDVKELGKLHSVGLKTAERILLFRKIKGEFKRISELSEMPAWHKKNFNRFVKQNYLSPRD